MLTEPETPYEKHPPGEHPEPEPEPKPAPEGENIAPPPPTPPPYPEPGKPPPQPLTSADATKASQTVQTPKVKCQICGRTYNSKAELDMHMQTQHSSPKKKP